MSTIICPHCGEIIQVDTYYSRHKQEIKQKYKERMKDPEFVEYRRKIALKSYHKNKG
jgi:hypothetical protein